MARDDAAAPAVSFHRLRAADAGELLTLQRAAFVAEALLYGTVEIPPLTESLDELLDELDANIVLGGHVGGRLVAAARLTIDGEIGWVSRVAVAPDQQGRGIGRALLGAIEEAAPVEVRRFQLGAGAKSRGNLALYEHLGYREVDTMVDRAGITLVVMAKDRAG